MPVLEALPTVAETALAELRTLGVSVSLDKSGGLRVMPRAAVTDQVRRVVALFRPQLLEYLQERAGHLPAPSASSALVESPAVAQGVDEALLAGLPPGAAASWQERGWYKLVASKKFGGDTIIRAMDTAPIHELHDGCVVYRNAEIRRQAEYPQPLHVWHPLRKQLFGKWAGDGWKSHKQIGQLRTSAGIGDHHRRKIVALVEHLVVCGVMEFAEPDGRGLMSDCYRIVPPGRRVTIEP